MCLIIAIPIALFLYVFCHYVCKKIDQAIDAWFRFLDDMEAEYEENQRARKHCTEHARLRAK